MSGASSFSTWGDWGPRGGFVLAPSVLRPGWIVAELMAGSRGISAACKSVCFFIRSWELGDSPLEDCLHSDVSRRLLDAASHNVLAMCWIGLVRTSWSRARRNRSGKKGWPAPIRDREHLLGLPDLPPNDRRKVLEGNKQASWAAKLFDTLSCLGVPCVIENPASSMLWDLPGFKRLSDKYSSVQLVLCLRHAL